MTGREDARGPAVKLGPRQYLGYAAGDAANNLAFSMSSMFLLLYYTDVVGIAAATVGTLFLVIRVWDAFADIFAGRMVDRTSTRWGKFRPYLLFVPLPLLLLNVAVFTVPDLSETAKVVYAFVSYGLFGLAYSLVNIPYGSLATAMTQDSAERSKLASGRVVGANLAILVLAVVVSPQIEGADDLQGALTAITLGLVVVGTALFLATFFTAREQVDRPAQTFTVRETARALKENRAMVVLCLGAVTFLTGWFSLQTVTIYYARDVLGNASYYAVLVVVQTLTTFVAAAFIPRLVRAIGKKGGYQLLGVIAIVGALGLTFAPASTPAFAIALFAVLGVGLGGVNTLMFALASDTVDYGEWKSGVRTEGANYSIFSFMRKVGQAVGAALAAFAIGIGGYVAGQSAQPDSAVDAIKIASGVIPAAFLLLSVAIMAAYPLTEERFRQIVAEIAARRVRSAS